MPSATLDSRAQPRTRCTRCLVKKTCRWPAVWVSWRTSDWPDSGVRSYRHQLGECTVAKRKSEIQMSFENCVKCLSGFEDLDILLSNVPKGRRADYALANRTILIEQKITGGPSARHKRESIEAMFERMTGEPHHDIGQILEKMPYLNSDVDRRELETAVNRKTNFVQDMFSNANKQLGSTVGLLNLRWAHGLLVILDDHENGEVHPKEIVWRAACELKRTNEDGRRRYGNVLSVFVLSRHTKIKRIFTSGLDISHIGSPGNLLPLAPVAANIINFYNSVIPNRTGLVEGKIPSSISWPLTN